MAAVAVLPVTDVPAAPKPMVLNFNKSGQALITVIEVPNDGLNEVDKEVAAFILNSTEFMDLQKYLEAGLALPSSGAIFTSIFSETYFKKMMPSDVGVYEEMKLQLPLVHEHCVDFKSNTLGKMISLGGYIANFSKESSGLYRDISEKLKLLAQDDLDLNDPKAVSAQKVATSLLIRLGKKAKGTEEKCAEIQGDLQKFKTKTEGDKTRVYEIDTRLENAAPPDTNSMLQKLRVEAEQWAEAIKEEAKKEKESKPTAMSALWLLGGVVGTIVGTAIYASNSTKSLECRKKLEELDRIHKEKMQQLETEEQQLQLAIAQMTGLKDMVNAVDDTIGNAIKAVDKMARAFSNIQTNCGELKEKMGDVEADMIDEEVEMRKRAIEELDEAAHTWALVREVAAQFQASGLVKNITDLDPEKLKEGDNWVKELDQL